MARDADEDGYDSMGTVWGYQGLTADEQRAMLRTYSVDFDDGGDGPPELVVSDDEGTLRGRNGETPGCEGGTGDADTDSEDEDEAYMRNGKFFRSGKSHTCFERTRSSSQSSRTSSRVSSRISSRITSCSHSCCNLSGATQASSEAALHEDSEEGRHARRAKAEAAAEAWRHKRSVCLAEVVYPEGTEELMLAGAADTPKYISLKVVLDSGAGTHVVNRRAIPGYKVMESALSKAGAAFVGADGGRIANHGESLLKIVSEDSNGNKHHITSNFQVADVTKALWSVGLICDSGLDVRFKKHEALILDSRGVELCRFERIGGLYVTTVMLENPGRQGFHRQGA